MKTISQKLAISQASEALSRHLAAGPSRVVQPSETLRRKKPGRLLPDAIVKIGGNTFLIEYKASGKVNFVAPAIERIREARKADRSDVWLLVVPFMHEAGRTRCELAEVSWLDLSGNAEISGPGLRISVRGHPNAFRGPGRPSDLFAPRSSRVARVLLYQFGHTLSQRQLATETGLSEGYVSRIVRGLQMDGLVERALDGRVKAKEPSLLLDAWLEAYTFKQHSITAGHIPARSGQSLVDSLSRLLADAGVEYAHTGLGAAWLYSHFASFRLATVYVREELPQTLLSSLGFTPTDIGANTWLTIPKDDAVFWGKRELAGVPCVHPIQVMLDLKDHPERSAEAAADLRPIALRTLAAL